MNFDKSALQSRVDRLYQSVSMLDADAVPDHEQKNIQHTLISLQALTRAVESDELVFGIEEWHVIHDDPPLDQPGEMLLRLTDDGGEALAPYPAIITFYQNNLTAEIDTVLCLCALKQFEETDERQVSINISARSLNDADFVKTVLGRIELMKLPDDHKIILEIHESTSGLVMNKKVLSLFRQCGIAFAMDDVGLSMNDVLRLSEFEDIADFIKVDRKSVCAHPEDPTSLDHVLQLVFSSLPDAIIVAEGVKSAEHALIIHEFHPQIRYAQGLYLPDRDTFAKDWAAVKAAGVQKTAERPY